MTQYRAKIAAVAFAILLLLPTLDQTLGLSARFQSTENRNLNAAPPLNFPHVRTFVKLFDQYYKENFGGRNVLFYAYSRWKLRVLGESPLPEKVVVGKNGWFYLGNSYNHVVDQHRGLRPLSADSARVIADHLMRRQAELTRQGIRLYVFIAPDSHTIYPEHLPDALQPTAGPSRLDALKQAMTQTDVSFIDIRDTLRAAKRNYVVYNRTDTHWNDYGTLVGCAALLNRIREDYPALTPVRRSNYVIQQQRGAGGDLVNMLTLQNEVKDPIHYVIQPAPGVMARQTATVPNNVSGFPSTRFAGTGGPHAPKLLFIGDSFSHSMMQFLPGYFREAYFVRGSRLDSTLVRAEQPDVLVLEVVERNLGNLVLF